MNQITVSWWLKKRRQRIQSSRANEMSKINKTDTSLLDGVLGKRAEPQPPTQTPRVQVVQSRHSQKTCDFARGVSELVSGPKHKPTRDEMNQNIMSSMVPKNGSGKRLRKSPFDLQ